LVADDWNYFIVISSLWASRDLIPDDVWNVWSLFCSAYCALLHGGGPLTAEAKEKARENLADFAKGVEEVSTRISID